jgi:hypothetical protein
MHKLRGIFCFFLMLLIMISIDWSTFKLFYHLSDSYGIFFYAPIPAISLLLSIFVAISVYLKIGGEF